jgi:hypothetical protein
MVRRNRAKRRKAALYESEEDMSEEPTSLTKLASALMKHNVPSFSPETGRMLLGIGGKVRLAANEETDKETKKLLKMYADAIEGVCRVAALHQGAVIGTLDKLVTEVRVPKMWPSSLGRKEETK